MFLEYSLEEACPVPGREEAGVAALGAEMSRSRTMLGIMKECRFQRKEARVSSATGSVLSLSPVLAGNAPPSCCPA